MTARVYVDELNFRLLVAHLSWCSCCSAEKSRGERRSARTRREDLDRFLAEQ